eukprot:4596735-Alexandrium_andersonii.AAC.2
MKATSSAASSSSTGGTAALALTASASSSADSAWSSASPAAPPAELLASRARRERFATNASTRRSIACRSSFDKLSSWSKMAVARPRIGVERAGARPKASAKERS